MSHEQVSGRGLQSDRQRPQGPLRARLALLRRDQRRLRKLDIFTSQKNVEHFVLFKNF